MQSPFSKLLATRCFRTSYSASDRAVRAYGSSSAAQQPSIDTRSTPFAEMRQLGVPFVDKTGAIADLLCAGKTRRAFFARPRRFGKSLTLDIMAELLRHGAAELEANQLKIVGQPASDQLFNGLAVFDRLHSEDVRDSVLHQPHFVVHLGLAEAESGKDLRACILRQLGSIAADAFPPGVARLVRTEKSAGGALREVLNAVPRSLRRAVLVDEYDSAILTDLSRGRWGAAEAGIATLKSLLVASKGPRVSIDHFVVTGVARFPRNSLFSGANNFEDISADPLLCRAIGFSAEEIAANFSSELECMELGSAIARATLAAVGGAGQTVRDTNLKTLAWWFNGYCFDGETSCFNPTGVLQALGKGVLEGSELDGAASNAWLGFEPARLVKELWDCDKQRPQVPLTAALELGVIDVESRVVDAQAMLLQAGLLSLYPQSSNRSVSGNLADVPDAPGMPLIRTTPTPYCQVPNEFARATLRSMANKAVVMAHPTDVLSHHMASILSALRGCHAGRFEHAVKTLLQALPSHMLKGGGGAGKASVSSGSASTSNAGNSKQGGANTRTRTSSGAAQRRTAGSLADGVVDTADSSASASVLSSGHSDARLNFREAPFHAALWACLHVGIPSQIAVTVAEANVQTGRCDLVLLFTGKPLVWIIELGVSKQGSLGRDASVKLAQAMKSATAFKVEDVEVVCCSVVVAELTPASVARADASAAPEDEFAVQLQWEMVQPAPGKQLTTLPEAAS